MNESESRTELLIDQYERTVDYLRVSVTERCNFRCQYCMPEKPFSWVPRENLLSFEELFSFIKIAIDEGVKKIRITGGEPLLRESIDSFIKMIVEYKHDIDLAMTTNGYLLKGCAEKLHHAGLKRINVSIDTLNTNTALYLAKKDVLADVLEGIEAARQAGLKIKVNMVPLQGINDNEIVEVLEYCKERNMSIRFIEYMQNEHASNDLVGLKSPQILNIIGSKYSFSDDGFDGHSPSHYYKMDDGYRFGIIEPYKDDFCKSCNRLRLSAEGDLIPCLYFDEAKNVKSAIQGHDLEKVKEILNEVVWNKPEKNRWGSEELSTRAFYETGG